MVNFIWNRFIIVFLLIPIAFSTTNAQRRKNELPKIRQLILSIEQVPVEEPKDAIIVPKQSVGIQGHGANRAEVFETKMAVARTFEKLVAFNPNVDALYPGALVQGASLKDGTLNPIGVERTPLTITVTDLVAADPKAKYSMKIEEPNHGSITNGYMELVNQNLTADQPAKISYNSYEVSSIDEGFIKLGASAKWASGSVEGSFKKSEVQKRTTFMVRFIQSYYTVSCEPPKNPISFLSANTRYDDFSTYANKGNPPVYIASVTYGRELWLLIESNHDANEVREALNAAFSAGFASGKANLDASQRSLLDESSIQLFALGGSGSPAVKVVSGNNTTELQQYLVAGANYSRTSPGVLISYTARYLKDNSIARVSSSTDYTIRTFSPIPEKTIKNIEFTFNTGNDDKDDDNHVGIRLTLMPQAIVLYENGDIRPSQSFGDGDPTWHDDRPVYVPVSINRDVYQSDMGSHIKIDVWKSGGAHWHFGFISYVVFEGEKKLLGSIGSNDRNFGGGYNSESWTYAIPW